MPYYGLMVIAFFMGIFGEYCCKLSSQTVGWRMYGLMAVTAFSWGSGALTWMLIYRQKSISEVVAIYNPSQMILLATMGIFMFGEPLTWRLFVAYILVGFCVWLLK